AEVRSPSLPARARVGLTTGERDLHLTAAGGRVEIRLDDAAGQRIGEIRGGETWTVEPRSREFAIRDEEGTLVGGRRWGSPSRSLVLVYEPRGARVTIPEAGDFGPGSYGRGTIELQLYACAGGCELRVIARLELEEYLRGLGEVPSSWPAAALRAQATAARSYAVVLIKRGLRGSCDCHMSDGTSDQVYVGWSKETGPDGDRWVAAVEDTAGRAVVHGGAVIQAFYASSDGGHSEDVEDVWHGGDPAFSIPWLSGVCDPGESNGANPWTDWTRSFGAASVTSRLAPYTGGIGRIRDFRNAVRGDSGRIVRVRAVGTDGAATIEGGELRAALGLPDDRVWINADRNITGAIRERYDGLMCAPGLATSPTTDVSGGAQQFFQDGGLYRNDDRAITVWLRGALDREYRAVKAARGVLGVPLASPRTAGRVALGGCAGCRRADFVDGRIYLKPGLGAHALWGRVLTEYLDRSGPGGALGYPVTRVRRLDGGGTRARFEHGTITCADAGGCQVS
ncbi:MAG TPA: SpoIID/LytB domain-containing protein, partial [Actinomycetota bacterium]|nr:SpoIID/LytB domain-containing protein [Actinomycetota bacterium]